MTIKIEKTTGFDLIPSVCPKCNAPTLDQTSTREDCENCGYWLIFSTGEGSELYEDID